MLIKHLFAASEPMTAVDLAGWVRSRRDAKGFSFLEVNDGSCVRSVQVIVDAGLLPHEELVRLATGASVRVEGELVASPAAGQKWEVRARRVELLGDTDATYPLQKKGHTLEFLRSIAHLRPRSNLFGAVFRTRSRMSFAVHRFFQERDFVHVHTPIITGSDCEGAGELFRVTTLDPARPAPGAPDFFGRPSYLTVSGQLEAETFACALGRVYTFGPTFRAENSNTSRHAAEFWMIEPEMAFCDLAEDMSLAEDFVRTLAKAMLTECSEEVELFAKLVDKTLPERLRQLAEQPFPRLPYAEAISILQGSGKKFEFPAEDGVNLQSEHERFLTEEHFKSAVIVYNYPKSIKPFYMRENDDGKTVTAMDVLVPGIGEIIGGAQREERLEVLDRRMAEHGMKQEDYWWYRDLRRFGTVPHAGFGLGFERLLMLVTGITNIRDVIPFARTPGSADF